MESLSVRGPYCRMGAGASIEDADELKKEYEKVKPNLTEEQKKTLEDTYHKVEGKNEFLIIGKCKQAYAGLGIADADPAFLKKDREKPKEVVACKDAQPPAPEGVTRFKLTDLPKCIKEAVAQGKTPLILDASDGNKVDTFFNYAKGGRVLDAKGMALAHSMQGKAVDECLEDARKYSHCVLVTDA